MKVLSISPDLELLQLRKAILQAAGHEVVLIDSAKEAALAAQSPEGFDAVLLCHRFPAAAARQTVRLLRQSHPDTRIIYIAHVYGEWPEVEADRYVVGSDGADVLARVLEEVHA
jgi:DNA-binding response OmpR family regulator